MFDRVLWTVVAHHIRYRALARWILGVLYSYPPDQVMKRGIWSNVIGRQMSPGHFQTRKQRKTERSFVMLISMEGRMKITKIDAFQVSWSDNPNSGTRSAFVKISTDEVYFGIGEASPMQGGLASLGIIIHELAPALIGKDPLDHAVLLDTLYHKLIKLGPEGALSGALAALDIALWDLKGKLFRQPIFKLLGGAWRESVPFYASIGNNGRRTVDEVVQTVEKRLSSENPALVKIRWDGDRTKLDVDIPGDIAKAKAVRKLVGDDFPLAFDANNGYSVGGAIRVGRALEELGYLWFEEPVQHYQVKAMGEVAQRLDILVSAGEQTYTLQALVDLINAGVRMI